ncbi:MAG: DivIVA domain-containing protein [Candidatus Nanopelagicales bacterium]|nr:DivIVA domain-containing protein [Candidatus Nanopelagicales bacterium]
MVLTPTEVHAQQFTTVRMRTGYDMDEVDAFLDVVEAEISRLLGDNDDLRAQLTQAQSRVLAAEQKSARAEGAGKEEAKSPSPRQGSNVTQVQASIVATPEPTPVPASDPTPVPVSAPVPDPVSASVPASQTPAPQDKPDATAISAQAFAMLEIAQRTAEETVSTAKAEATQIVSSARAEARVVTADLDSQRDALETQVGRLRTFERNYRVKLRDHIAAQLKQFDAAAHEENVAAESGPEELVAAAEQAALPGAPEHQR